MNGRVSFQINNIKTFKSKAFNWLRRFEVSCILDSHTETYPNHSYAFQDYDLIIAAGVNRDVSSLKGDSLSSLDKVLDDTEDWHFGFFSYDLKNRLEKLTSNNIDMLQWPDFYFFSPEILIFIKNDTIEIEVIPNTNYTSKEIFNAILSCTIHTDEVHKNCVIHQRLSKSEYINRVETLRNHILLGDLYEVNFCQEFYSNSSFDPYSGYLRLNEISPTPFSSFFRLNNKYLLSASPERFIKKSGDKIISQPIKGTAKRGATPEEDIEIIKALTTSKKENAENVMIVDLVRNDLSKISKSNTVTVDELCGVYGFKQVHQMISTITAELHTSSMEDIIKATFPMGSMTGAPKYKSMQLAEKYETSKRGLYSGAVGYISPKKDFDFNVVIRSLQYNSDINYLSFMVGGAITFLSDAESEYEECLIKASAINELLNFNNHD